MSKLQIFYAEGGRYVSDEYSRASVGDIAFGGELNQTKLYGTQPGYTEPHPFMFLSDGVSDADGVLESQTVVNIDQQNINGLTLIFDTAGGTHPKSIGVTLMSKTTPNFTNRIESESYSMDMTGRVSDSGVVRGMRIDAVTGEMTEDADYMSSGIIYARNGITDTIRTQGIDWTVGDLTKTGICTYSLRWSGVRNVPVFKAFTTISELLAGDTSIGSILIDDDGNAQIDIGYNRFGNYFALCMQKAENPIVTVNEEITYGEAHTSTPTEYISASASAEVDDTTCMIAIEAENVTGISVAMLGVNAPYVRHKLTTIYSGAMTMYSADSIVSCDIIEQVDVLSEALPTNTCDIVMIEPRGILYNPSVRQRIEVYRDGCLRGVFFIDNVKKSGRYRYRISAHGITGELERSTFYGDVYQDKDAERLIAEIFGAAGIHHIMEDEPQIKTISGHLPISDCKTSLRTVLFAVGMTLDVSRSPHPRVRRIEVINPSIERRITNTLIGETVTDDSRIARIEMKTRVYINPTENTEHNTTAVAYSHKEYGKGYKPIVIIPDMPSVMRGGMSTRPVMSGSSSNRILWDGTWIYTYTDEETGEEYYTNEWSFVMYPWAVRESIAEVIMSGAIGATINYDNTMISPENAGEIGTRCLGWHGRGKTLDAGIVGDVAPGDHIEVEISDGAVFAGTVTQVRYSPIGNKMIQEVVMCGTDNGPNARRL